MARTKRSTRSYITGEKGRNRVRVFADRRSGIMQIEWWEGPRRCLASLKHRDWELAKSQADDLAADYPKPEEKPEDSEPQPLTLSELFEMYLEEVTPTKGDRSQTHDRRTLAVFEDFLGADRAPSSLSKRDWDRFIKRRSEGSIGVSGRAVSARTVERDLRLLLAVLNWAEKSKDDSGEPLVDRNPLRGLTPPKEKNPTRVVLTEEEYTALLGVAREINWRFRVALILAHETGHRIGAIRRLRWSDIDLEAGQIRWRAEAEKNGYEHVTPMTADAQKAVEEARAQHAGIGEAPVFPAPKNAAESASRYLMRDWWRRAEKSAGMEPKRGRGWHALRRKFASDLMHAPLKVLCDLGGWRTHRTVLECYQHPDGETMRETLETRRRA